MHPILARGTYLALYLAVWTIIGLLLAALLAGPGGLAASQGTGLARELAERHGKPLLVLALDEDEAPARAARWLDDLLSARPPGSPLRLGIGGPRESEVRGIYARAFALLRNLLRGR